jgi:hypothetical protein
LRLVFPYGIIALFSIIFDYLISGLIKSQSETIQEEQRTNISLIKTCEILELSKTTLLLENESIKKERKKGFFARLFS